MLTAPLEYLSIFQKPLMEAYGFAQSVPFACTIVIAMIGLSGPIGGWLQRKAPAHIIMTVAGIGFGSGWSRRRRQHHPGAIHIVRPAG